MSTTLWQNAELDEAQAGIKIGEMSTTSDMCLFGLEEQNSRGSLFSRHLLSPVGTQQLYLHPPLPTAQVCRSHWLAARQIGVDLPHWQPCRSQWASMSVLSGTCLLILNSTSELSRPCASIRALSGVWFLIQEDPTCCRATKPVHHKYWACAPEPRSCNYWAHVVQQLPKLAYPRARALQREASAVRNLGSTARA